jgi:Bacterial capsule synthesis protein PGA_cap
MRPAAAYRWFLCRLIPAVSIVLGMLLAACSDTGLSTSTAPPHFEAGTPLPATLTPFQPVSPTMVPTEAGVSGLPEDGGTQASTSTNSVSVESPTPAPVRDPGTPPGQDRPIGVWIAPYLPAGLRDRLSLPAGFERVESQEQATVRLEAGDQNPVSRWVFALVAPFPTIVDGVSGEDLRRSWDGDAAGPFAGEPLLVDESTLQILAAWWGEPEDGAVRPLPDGELLGEAWSRGHSWAIVPFESLVPEWKVLQVDGRSPLWKEFDPVEYILTVPISLQGDPGLVSGLQTTEGGDALGIPATNRDPARLTTVALTGVTALVRATAFTMNRNGIAYPAQDIGDLLRSADLTHISNEIPFSPECPPPNPTQEGLRFCSDPAYIELLEEVGTDIVELTGDHFGDWGPEAMRYTLDLYEEEDWTYYGGGHDRGDARQARLFEHNGNRVAFIGCNAKGGGYATASESQPGAVACDTEWMHAEIARLATEGYQVIATFQHFEYYTYHAQPDQIADFRGMAEAGAAIVSGSQAHQPQGMEFNAGAFIHYGLGNLFFDQYNYCTDNACNDGFIDRHIFFDGRYISTELIPIVFVDYARPRPMDAEEKAILFEKIFSASGW